MIKRNNHNFTTEKLKASTKAYPYQSYHITGLYHAASNLHITIHKWIKLIILKS